MTLTVAMKTAGDPLAMLPAARREVAAIDPNLPISRSATMEQRLSDSLARRRISVQLMTLFAVLAGRARHEPGKNVDRRVRQQPS